MCRKFTMFPWELSLIGSFSDNFYNSDGKDCDCVPLILQKNNKLKLQ